MKVMHFAIDSEAQELVSREQKKNELCLRLILVQLHFSLDETIDT